MALDNLDSRNVVAEQQNFLVAQPPPGSGP